VIKFIHFEDYDVNPERFISLASVKARFSLPFCLFTCYAPLSIHESGKDVLISTIFSACS